MMIQLIIVLAFIGLALVYFGLLYAGLRLLAVLKLIPKEWFNGAKTHRFTLIAPHLTRGSWVWHLEAARASSSAAFVQFADRQLAGSSTQRRFQPGRSVLTLTGPSVLTQSALMTFQGKDFLWRRASYFGSEAAHYDMHTTIVFYNFTHLPIIANRAFGVVASGDLKWRN